MAIAFKKSKNLTPIGELYWASAIAPTENYEGTKQIYTVTLVLDDEDMDAFMENYEATIAELCTDPKVKIKRREPKEVHDKEKNLVEGKKQITITTSAYYKVGDEEKLKVIPLFNEKGSPITERPPYIPNGTKARVGFNTAHYVMNNPKTGKPQQQGVTLYLDALFIYDMPDVGGGSYDLGVEEDDSEESYNLAPRPSLDKLKKTAKPAKAVDEELNDAIPF